MVENVLNKQRNRCAATSSGHFLYQTQLLFLLPIGLSNCLFLYGSIAFLNCIWGVIFIPDNRGKSLVKVEEMYEKNNKNEINEKTT